MMNENKSLNEIISGNLEGIWCNGLVILEVEDDTIFVDNIYNNNGKELKINGYPIETKNKVFSKVIEMDYKKALEEFKINNKSIISPRVRSEEVTTFDGLKSFEYGGNVYEHTSHNKIIVNDKDPFDIFDEILDMGFISEKEMNGKWLVF